MDSGHENLTAGECVSEETSVLGTLGDSHALLYV